MDSGKGHNVLIPLQNMDEKRHWENRPFSGMMGAPKRKPDIKMPIKKKRRNRMAFTTEQIRILESLFVQNKYINSDCRRALSKALNVGDRSLKIWFQNRRMKDKRESSESSIVESDSSNEKLVCNGHPPRLLPSIESIDSSSSVASIESQDTCPSLASDEFQEPTSTMDFTEPHDSNQTENNTKEDFTPATNQYQFPYFYAQNTEEQPIQNVHSSDYNTWQNNDMRFYNDNNIIYPTQYYPYNNANYQNEFNYYQYQQENFMGNYWNANFASYYYQNEGE